MIQNKRFLVFSLQISFKTVFLWKLIRIFDGLQSDISSAMPSAKKLSQIFESEKPLN